MIFADYGKLHFIIFSILSSEPMNACIAVTCIRNAYVLKKTMPEDWRGREDNESGKILQPKGTHTRQKAIGRNYPITED
jgi:hypothetical protein